jgi:cytochrome P450
MLNSLGNQLLVTNPQLLADVLVHKCYDFTKPTKISNFLRLILGDGLIIVEGDQHKFLRRNTMPAFHFRHIKELYPMMWDKARTLTKTLKREITDAPAGRERSSVIEISTWASKVTIDIIGIAGLGRNFEAVEKAGDPLQETYEELLEPDREKLVFAMMSLALGFSFVRFLPWRMNAVFKRLTTSLNNICHPMIQEKREAIQEKGDDHFDVLSLLIKSNNFSDEALKDQLLTFLAAG